MKTPTALLKHISAFCLCNALLWLPLTAQAYIGPGAGLSLLGALWALVVALGAAFLFILAWPIRRLLRRLRADRTLQEANVMESEAEPLNPDAATTHAASDAETHQ